MKIYEFINYYKQIVIEVDEGSIEGYVISNTAEQIPNWVSRNGYPNEIATKISKNHKVISFANNMYVDEDARGAGIGGSLLSEFIDESAQYGAEVIYLSADTSDEQLDGFDLVQWYKSFGFEQLIQGDDPLMMLDL